MNINFLLDYQEQLIESVVLILLYFIIKLITNKVIGSVGRKFSYPKGRIEMLQKMVKTIVFYIIIGVILFIWGVDQNKLVYYTTSLLAIIGIAFFAQWSIISNITSTIIIYFNHPVRLGDTITVLDKEYDIEGTVDDIGIFFLTIKTQSDEEITMPSNILMQKMVKIKPLAVAKKKG